VSVQLTSSSQFSLLGAATPSHRVTLPSYGDKTSSLPLFYLSAMLRAYLFLLLSWIFPAEKIKSQKQEQTVNFLIDFWNAEKQAFEEMN
jgi:hypothetical protein